MNWLFRVVPRMILLIVTVAAANDYGPWLGQSPREQMLARSWEQMGIDSNETILQLRQAVEEHPHDIELSCALIHMLSVYCQEDEADQFSRTALRQNPGNPELVIARASAMEPSPALDVLTALAKLPGQQARASRLSEWLHLGLRIPPRGDMNRVDYVTWIDRLIYDNQVDRAAAILEEGLAWTAGKNEEAHNALKQRKPMVFALQNRSADAIAAQEEENFPQIPIEPRYVGLCDVFLMTGQPKLAIKSFGNRKPDISAKGDPQDFRALRKREARQELSRVLAWAYALDNEWEPGIALLDNSPEMMGQLILLQIDLRAGRRNDAKIVANALVLPLHFFPGSRSGPPLPSYGGAASLTPIYRSALAWLIDHYPEKADLIREQLGSPDYGWKVQPTFPFGFVPITQLLPSLRSDLAAAEKTNNIQKIRDAEWFLIRALEQDRQYAAAAREAARLARLPRDRPPDPPRINYDALEWCIFNRKVDAEALYITNPGKLAEAKRLLQIARNRKSDSPEFDDGLSWKQRIERLVRIGPGSLASVYHDFGPNAISGADRSPYVKIIEGAGGLQDTPLLIDTLALIALKRPYERYPEGSDMNQNDAQSVEAIQHCLEKLTDQKCPEVESAQRARFWLEWWDKNGQSVLDRYALPADQPVAK